MAFLIIITFLVLNSFFGALIVPNWLTTIMLFAFWFYGRKVKTIYATSFKFILVGLICSSISCWFYRGQTLVETFQTLTYYYGILFYFFLKARKFSLEDMEKALFFLILAFDILYIVQYHLLDYGVNFLNIDDWMMNDSSIEGNRLRVMSSGLYSLGIFFGMVKYKHTSKYIYLILVVLGLYVMLLSGFRQLLASLAVCMIFYFYRIGYRLRARHIIPAVILMIGIVYLYQLPEVQNKIAGMILRNESGQNLTNKDYVRIAQWDFYMNDFFKSPIEQFFGAGLPRRTSAYGHWFENQLKYVDWGLIGQSWMLGIITVVGFIMFAVKAIRIKVSPQYKYISLWYIFLLLSSVTNFEFVRNGNFLVHAMALYVVELAYKEYIKKQISNGQGLFLNHYSAV